MFLFHGPEKRFVSAKAWAKLLILHSLWILKLKVHVALLDMASNFAGDVWRDLSKSEELYSELHGTCFEFELKILL